ncbi:hypothetical protein [Streptomyces sp. NPDC059009]|uniref:hypothetical protein n=1 Tax=Streptomyces sp. NPDC059009 TaxID=3346694 RepID=UPI0036B5BC3A
MSTDILRRTLLQRSAVVGGAAVASAAGPLLLASPAHAAAPATPPAPPRGSENPDKNRILTGRNSTNGWEMEKVADGGGSIWTRPVPGAGFGITARIGDVDTVLVHVVRRFHYEIDELRPGDVVGWLAPNKVPATLPESNQASGTAVAIRPGSFPPKVKDGFFAAEQAVVRDILADCEGTVRWGGDDELPYEALFCIDVQPGDPRLARVAEKLRDANATPGQGAGALVDPALPERRRLAAAYH